MGCTSFGLSLAFLFCLPCDGSSHRSFIGFCEILLKKLILIFFSCHTRQVSQEIYKMKMPTKGSILLFKMACPFPSKNSTR
jgi:hypothetical protein